MFDKCREKNVSLDQMLFIFCLYNNLWLFVFCYAIRTQKSKTLFVIGSKHTKINHPEKDSGNR